MCSGSDRHRALPWASIAETRSTPQTVDRGKAALIREANTPVPQPTSRIARGCSPHRALTRAMIARCDGPNSSRWRMQRS